MAKVYISSTSQDLMEHRQRVYHQLQLVGHDVKAMEDYVAQEQRPLAKCLQDVSDCDVYIGLFAWRYGFIPADHNPEGLSITELEYRQAGETGKERLIFLQDDKFDVALGWLDSHTGNGEGGKLIKQLREDLQDKHLVSFFKTPDHLASLVSVAVEKWGRQVVARERDEASKKIIAELTPLEKIVVDRKIGHARLMVINDDICTAMTDIVVSSDDNQFRARDGVSKLLMDKLGPSVRRELDHYCKAGFRQGQLAITTGGEWGRRAVIHAAVIDLEYNLWPTLEAIRTLTQRSLECALALGAGSIAFPVLGGGYATKSMSSSDSVSTMVTEMRAFMASERRDLDQLRGVTLYIFNRKDIAGVPKELRGADGG